MSSRALWKIAAALIVAAVIALSAVPPAHAALGAGRSADSAAAWTAPERGFFALLLRLLAKAGGAMDPNGNH